MPSNEPATTRRPSRLTVRGALLWVVVGAALFLGVGAALPVWTVYPPGSFVLRPSPSDPSFTEMTIESPPGEAKTTLWKVVAARVAKPRWIHGIGVITPVVRLDDSFLLGPLILLACGVLAGLFGYSVYLDVQWWNGGGA
jgi:hypothetical protein